MSGSSPHISRVFRERRWPYQWIGMCSCGNGTRCNSKSDAMSFLRREGCLLND